MSLEARQRRQAGSVFNVVRGLKVLALALVIVMPAGSLGAESKNKGLNQQALEELAAVGVNNYLGNFTPISSEDAGDGWVKHSFDPAGGSGPICIAGTPYSVFTRAGNPAKLLIFLQGGGACWQDFYNCNILAEAQEPPLPRVGIWDFDSKDNPFRGYSIVFMPYCDGSVFIGDNDVVDPGFPYGPVRFHRGLRNLSAGIDLAMSMFPDAHRITLAGSSAGGVGVAQFAPFLVRFVYGNNHKLFVLNDAGPVAFNLNDTTAVQARANDWQFGQFYPASCTDCDDQDHLTRIIMWRLDNDATVSEAYYSTDGDITIRFFLNLLPPTPRIIYRDLIEFEHGVLNGAHPDRYKRFIVSDDTSHTALQTPLFYTQDANDFLLNEWTQVFIRPVPPFWIDIVEDYVPGP